MRQEDIVGLPLRLLTAAQREFYFANGYVVLERFLDGARLAALRGAMSELQERANEYREKLIETLADVDDSVMEKYLEGEEISVEEIKAGIRRATITSKARKRKFTPARCHRGSCPETAGAM